MSEIRSDLKRSSQIPSQVLRGESRKAFTDQEVVVEVLGPSDKRTKTTQFQKQKQQPKKIFLVFNQIKEAFTLSSNASRIK